MDKKEKILAVALKLFVENGFHGTSTALIAKDTEVANGTLFNYFKTKDDLIIALYLTVKNEINNHVFEKIGQNSSLKEITCCHYSESLSWAINNPLKFKYIQQFQVSPYFNQFQSISDESPLKSHLELIRLGIDQKVIKSLPIELIYTIISSQVFGLYQYFSENRITKKNQAALIKETFEMFWNSISL